MSAAAAPDTELAQTGGWLKGVSHTKDTTTDKAKKKGRKKITLLCLCLCCMTFHIISLQDAIMYALCTFFMILFFFLHLRNMVATGDPI